MSSSEILPTIFIVLCVMQFLFPVLASKIESRFGELGYKMKAEPAWSLFNTSNFWSEARKQNAKYKDSKISQLLLIRTIWWILAISTILGIVISDGK